MQTPFDEIDAVSTGPRFVFTKEERDLIHRDIDRIMDYCRNEIAPCLRPGDIATVVAGIRVLPWDPNNTRNETFTVEKTEDVSDPIKVTVRIGLHHYGFDKSRRYNLYDDKYIEDAACLVMAWDEIHKAILDLFRDLNGMRTRFKTFPFGGHVSRGDLGFAAVK